VTHWAARYIGTPWDPASQHCWGFARRVWHEVFGLDVPEVVIDGSSPYAARRALSQGHDGWVPVSEPVEGDAVLMARGQRPCHVGVWIAPDPEAGVLHSVERSGVVFTPPDRLTGLGYRMIGIYRRAA
jgi:hypothetical protein